MGLVKEAKAPLYLVKKGCIITRVVIAMGPCTSLALGGARLQVSQNSSSLSPEQSGDAAAGKFSIEFNMRWRRVGIRTRERRIPVRVRVSDDISMEVREDASHIFCNKS